MLLVYDRAVQWTKGVNNLTRRTTEYVHLKRITEQFDDSAKEIARCV